MPVVFTTLRRTLPAEEQKGTRVERRREKNTIRTEIFIVCILLSSVLCVGALAYWVRVVVVFFSATSFHSLIIIFYRFERCSEAYVIRLLMTWFAVQWCSSVITISCPFFVSSFVRAFICKWCFRERSLHFSSAYIHQYFAAVSTVSMHK